MSAENKYHYLLQQADNGLILGQRLAAWCGHGPALEQDIAMTNISLDLIGQARMWYQYAAELRGDGMTEDHLAYLRDAWDFKNVLLVEQPNGDFAHTILRQFFFDSFSHLFYHQLQQSADKRIKAIAEKSYKEALYHLKWSSNWVKRLGDGTEESHQKIQLALETLWPYAAELTHASEVDDIAQQEGYGVDLNTLQIKRKEIIIQTLEEAHLALPTSDYGHEGGKLGKHTENLGYILAELQFLQRAYPGLEW